MPARPANVPRDASRHRLLVTAANRQPPPSARGDWMESWLQTIRLHGSPTRACTEAGISRDTPYNRRETDPVFAAAWAEAREAWLDSLEYDSLGRIAHSERQGMPSVIAALALLKAYRPQFREVWQSRNQAEPAQVTTINQQLNVILSTADGRKLAASISRQLLQAPVHEHADA